MVETNYSEFADLLHMVLPEHTKAEFARNPYNFFLLAVSANR